jgi:hypothetical protein
MEAVERIREMEEILQGAKPILARLDEALEQYAALRDRLRRLERYYGGPDWRADLALDETGQLPSTLRRGVLSEDEVYDLLADEQRIRERMRMLLAAAETEETT